ncbi:serine hydrolase [Streptomyces sp. NPDC102340]|uniref:serine hydrolase n=1 Tax=unclassified Streptomyces TaxID=2593676 RepID=UPI0037FE2751
MARLEDATPPPATAPDDEAVLALWECDRGRLIDVDQLAELTAVAFEGIDPVFGNLARLALGCPLGRIGAQQAEASATFGWVGGGGSYVYADPATGISFAMTKTRLAPHFDTAQRLADITTEHIDPGVSTTYEA